MENWFVFENISFLNVAVEFFSYYNMRKNVKIICGKRPTRISREEKAIYFTNLNLKMC